MVAVKIVREVDDESVAASEPLSIQGEQQVARKSVAWASQADVDAWASEADPRVFACKERNRHSYPSQQEAGLKFDGIDKDTGLFIRSVPCVVCANEDGPRVVRVELWDVRQYRGVITRCDLVSAKPSYVDPTYLNQGHGRMHPKHVRSALATMALKGVSFTELRKGIMARAAESQKS